MKWSKLAVVAIRLQRVPAGPPFAAGMPPARSAMQAGYCAQGRGNAIASPAMTPLSLALIGFTIVFSSFISGVFGMAGGMILLGVLLNYLDVAAGMIFFSIIQLFANGSRAWQWRRYVLWPVFQWYVLGAAIAFALMFAAAFVPDKAMVYLSLGLMPFAVEVLPARYRPNIEWRGVPFVTGILTTIVQVLAGVGGLFLDVFFQKSMLDRKTTNATKAVVQSLSHVIRAAYFGSIAGFARVPLWACVPAILLAIAGTSLAPFVIERMTDHGFRRWTRVVIFAVSAVYLVRGAWLLIK
jgi:uncharacterized protein